ncbi:MAG: hypothetical protein AAFQ36_07680 [Pseudomonadota bacterium]
MKTPQDWTMPQLIRFMIYHTANGIALACILLLVCIYFDVMGLGTMLEKDTSGLATFLLFFQTSLTFGAANMGIAVMGLGSDEKD